MSALMEKIMTKEDVAKLFRKSEQWVVRMMACGALPHHYAGDTAMFYVEEILDAFLSDALAKTRRNHDQKKAKPEWQHQVRGVGQIEGWAPSLQEIRDSSRGKSLGK